MTIHRWLSIGLLTIATVAGAALLLQRQVQSDLHEQVNRLREGQRELAHVQAEHERLQKLRVPEAELERLRADHAALVRLRAEVAEMKSRVAARQAAAAR